MSAGPDPAPTDEPVVITDAGEPEAQPEKVMTIVEHLSELRRRVFISIAVVVVTSIIGFLVAPRVIEILKAPVTGPLVFTSPGAAFFLQVKLAVMIGIALASPVILYQLWAFVSPGLTRRERTAARPWIPLAVVFLVLGVAVAYLILPYTVGFLLSFQIPGVLEPLITAESYFGFVTTMFLAFGLVMQFPIVIVLLSKVGIISVERLRHARRYVFVGIFIFAVVVTPGGDPISPIIMALVMYPLYELTIYLVGRSSRQRLLEGIEPA
jgi:sec-independent protein translocase protein TatC